MHTLIPKAAAPSPLPTTILSRGAPRRSTAFPPRLPAARRRRPLSASPGRAVLGQPVRGRVRTQQRQVPSFSSAPTGYELLQRTPLGLEEYIEG